MTTFEFLSHLSATAIGLFIGGIAVIGVTLLASALIDWLGGGWLKKWLDRPMFSRPEPPKHEIRLFDEHGVPIRRHCLSGKSATELIRHLEEGWYR